MHGSGVAIHSAAHLSIGSKELVPRQRHRSRQASRVVKCRTVNRLTNADRWNKELVLGMMGVPWETIPGRKGTHIPVEISDDGQEVPTGSEDNLIPDNDDEGLESGMRFKGGPDKLHISQKAVVKYGTTPGCPACKQMERRGYAPGRLGYNHNETCRQRIFTKMATDPEYRTLVDKHGKMKVSAVSAMVNETAGSCLPAKPPRVCEQYPMPLA